MLHHQEATLSLSLSPPRVEVQSVVRMHIVTSLPVLLMRGNPIKLQHADESRSKHTHKQKDLLAVVLVLSLVLSLQTW
jgi:hypothetical protein